MIHLHKLCICSVQLWPLWFVDWCHITSLARQVGFGFSTYLSSDWTWVWSLLLFWHLVDCHLVEHFGTGAWDRRSSLCFLKSCSLRDIPAPEAYNPFTIGIQKRFVRKNACYCKVSTHCNLLQIRMRLDLTVQKETFRGSWGCIQEGVNTIHTSCWHLYTNRYYMAACTLNFGFVACHWT